MNSVEIFAGGGGLALGVSDAGFDHSYLVEWDRDSAKTLYHNNKKFGLHGDAEWIFNGDIHEVDFSEYREKNRPAVRWPPLPTVFHRGEARRVQ